MPLGLWSRSSVDRSCSFHHRDWQRSSIVTGYSSLLWVAAGLELSPRRLRLPRQALESTYMSGRVCSGFVALLTTLSMNGGFGCKTDFFILIRHLWEYHLANI